MDPHCTDICPIVSQEFVDAYHDLGKDSSRVVFVAVNVNQYYTGVAAMASFSKKQRLNTIPSWHFLTSSVEDLKSVWGDYGIQVEAPNPNADIVHTFIAYFIDLNSHERYLAAPTDDHTASGASSYFRLVRLPPGDKASHSWLKASPPHSPGRRREWGRGQLPNTPGRVSPRAPRR